MKVGHVDGMHCFIDSTSVLVKIESVSLYNCWTVYMFSLYSYGFSLKIETCSFSTCVGVCLVNGTYLLKKKDGNSITVSGLLREVIGGPHAGMQLN